METIEREGIMAQATETGEYIMDALVEMMGRARRSSVLSVPLISARLPVVGL